jgi:hypothetical protein
VATVSDRFSQGDTGTVGQKNLNLSLRHQSHTVTVTVTLTVTARQPRLSKTLAAATAVCQRLVSIRQLQDGFPNLTHWQIYPMMGLNDPHIMMVTTPTQGLSVST